MDKELNLSVKKLNPENKRIILKMEQYLESRYINEIAREDILLDIVGMALECQERGQSFYEAIGGDSEGFCRELVANAPKQSWVERILTVTHWLLLFLMILFPAQYILRMIFTKYAPGSIDGLIYSVPLRYLLKYVILTVVLTVGWFCARLYTYKPIKYVIGTYFAVFMLFFLGLDFFLDIIVRETAISISIIVWIIIFAVLLVLCDVAKRLNAMTVAYKKRKNQDK